MVRRKAWSAIATPQPGSETTGLTCVYDAWNELVQVSDGRGTVDNATYRQRPEI